MCIGLGNRAASRPDEQRQPGFEPQPGLCDNLTLIKGLGYKLYPSGKVWLDISPAGLVAGMLWSMSRIRSFRELLATGEGECRALVDTMAGVAPRSEKTISLARILAMKPADG